MARKSTLFVAAFLSIVLVLSAVRIGPVKAAGLADKYQELERLNKDIEDNKARLGTLEKDRKGVLGEIARLDTELAISEKELEYILVKMEYTSQEMDETNVEIEVIEERLAAQKAAFEARLTSIYKQGRTSYIDVLLSSKSLSDMMACLHYLKQLANDDNGIIDSYTGDHKELCQKKEELRGKLDDLMALQASEEQKRATVVSRSADRERYLTALQGEKQELEKALDEMQRESEALVKVIAELQAKEGLPSRTLSMIWPVTGYWVSDEFGWRYHPILGYDKFHSGLDYAADYNVSIKAAESGTVIFSGVNGGYGNCVIIDHGGGISTLYGHANSLKVQKGEIVAKGQVIALVGSTGLSTGPHLHFEVRVDGECVNPRDWLPR